MSHIRCIYDQEPNFPATDQHQDAKRYRVAGKIVDAIGEPTEAEVLAVLNPPKQVKPTLEQRIEALEKGA